MLFQVNRKINRKILSKILKNDYSFFIFNVKDVQDNFFLYNYFDGNFLHIKNLNKFCKNNILVKLFSGNIFFGFIESEKFFENLLDLNYFQINENNLELIGICHNKYFLNFNIDYLNMVNCLFSVVVVVFFLILLFINLFFFKLILLLKNSLFIKKC